MGFKNEIFTDKWEREQDGNPYSNVTGTTKVISGGHKHGLDTNQLNQNLDAFARLRVSNLTTLFDAKQIHDKLPLYWDDQEVSGTGTSSTYNTNQASTTLAVSATTAGKVVRQTYQRFNYSPGKSQLITMTSRMNAAGAGIKAGVGLFDDQDGLFYQLDNGVIYVVCRTFTSGSAVDIRVAQADWNLDPMNGTGHSGVTLDPTKTQILFMDFEWLGVGRVRFGVFIAGEPIYVHEMLNANINTVVYMSTPNLPLRYEIENDGTGAATDLLHLCSSVASEGGDNQLGNLCHTDSGAVSSLSSGTLYAMLGIRLQSSRLDRSILMATLSAIATSANDKAHWEMRWNPTVAGTFTYSDLTDASVQVATGAATNTVTGGLPMAGGYFTNSVPSGVELDNALRLGSAIDGTQDEIVLCVRPITNNITVEASLTWRELS